MKLKFSFLLLFSFLSEALLGASVFTLPLVDMETARRAADDFNRRAYEAYPDSDSDHLICVSSGSESEPEEEESGAEEKKGGGVQVQPRKRLYKRNVSKRSDTEEAKRKAEREARKVAIQDTTKALYLEVRSQLETTKPSLHKLYLQWRSETKRRDLTLFKLIKHHIQRFEFTEAKGLIGKLKATGMDCWEFNILRDAYTGLKKLHKYSVKFSDSSLDWTAARTAAYEHKFENFVLPLAKHHKNLRNVERAEALYYCLYGFISWTDVESYVADLYIHVYNYHASSRSVPTRDSLLLLDKAEEGVTYVEDDPGNSIVAAGSQFQGIRKELLNWFLRKSYYAADEKFKPTQVMKLFERFAALLDKIQKTQHYGCINNSYDLEKILWDNNFYLIVSEKFCHGCYGKYKKYMYFWVHKKHPIQVRIKKNTGEVTVGIVRNHPLKKSGSAYIAKRDSSGKYIFLDQNNEVLKWSQKGFFIPAFHEKIYGPQCWPSHVTYTTEGSMMNEAHFNLKKSQSNLGPGHASTVYSDWVTH